MLFLRFIFPTFIILLYAGGISESAQAQQSVDSELTQRITRSKNELQNVQRQISEKSRLYAQKLEQREQQIKEAREKVAVQQRMADEQLLGLEKLTERVNQWETQSNYQAHMLRHYRDSIGIKIPSDEQQGSLVPVLERLDAAMNPAWVPVSVVTAEGRVVTAPVLKLGPVEIALVESSRSAGLLTREAGLEPHILEIFDNATQKELWSLHQNHAGLYPFDPTLGNALQLREYGDGIFEHLSKGGLWAIPIVFFGIVSLLISVLKASQLARLPKVDVTLLDRLQGADASSVARTLAEVGSAQRRLAQIAIANPVSQQRDDLLVAQLMEYKHTLEKYMGVVATSAAIAPLLGLLGTVSGMIDTFKMMTIFGSGDASTVSGGISEALITTELGLIVAIPSLIISALLTRQIKHYIHKLENFAIRLSKVSFQS